MSAVVVRDEVKIADRGGIQGRAHGIRGGISDWGWRQAINIISIVRRFSLQVTFLDSSLERIKVIHSCGVALEFHSFLKPVMKDS